MIDRALIEEYETAVLRHRIVNSRALLRRRGLSDRLRAEIQQSMPLWLAEAEELGLDTQRLGWRQFPFPDRHVSAHQRRIAERGGRVLCISPRRTG